MKIYTSLFGAIDPDRGDAIYEAANTCGCGHSKRMHYDGGCQADNVCRCDEFEPGPEPGTVIDGSEGRE